MCINHLIVWSQFSFLHNYQWITFSAQSCLVYFFSARLHMSSTCYILSIIHKDYRKYFNKIKATYFHLKLQWQLKVWNIEGLYWRKYSVSLFSFHRSLSLSLTHLSLSIYIYIYMHRWVSVYVFVRKCSWCNGYCNRKWTQWHKFKSWTVFLTFHIALIPLKTVWSQLFSFQLWVRGRAVWVL